MAQRKPFPLLTAGIVILAVSLVLYIPMMILAVSIFFDMPQQIGIIGGADAPTAAFLFERMCAMPGFWIMLIGGFLDSIGMTVGIVMTFAGILDKIGTKKTP